MKYLPKRKIFALTLFFIGLLSALWFLIPGPTFASEAESGFLITGSLFDPQGQPIVAAEISAHLPDEDEAIAEAESQEDGSWGLVLDYVPGEVSVHIQRYHFVDQVIELDAGDLAYLKETRVLRIEELSLERKVTAGFWIATAIFVIVLLLIAFEILHSTTAALLGASAVLLVSALGTAFVPSMYILNFERALTYINWEVIFLNGVHSGRLSPARQFHHHALDDAYQLADWAGSRYKPPGIDHPRSACFECRRHLDPDRNADKYPDRGVCRDWVQRFSD